MSKRIEKFKRRFDELRGELTQEEFAKKLGLSRATVGFYICGNREPDAATLYKICKTCEVSSDWLIGLSDVKVTDATVQAINKEYGLTNETLKILKEENQYAKENFFKICKEGKIEDLEQEIYDELSKSKKKQANLEAEVEFILQEVPKMIKEGKSSKEDIILGIELARYNSNKKNKATKIRQEAKKKAKERWETENLDKCLEEELKKQIKEITILCELIETGKLFNLLNRITVYINIIKAINSKDKEIENNTIKSELETKKEQILYFIQKDFIKLVEKVVDKNL